MAITQENMVELLGAFERTYNTYQALRETILSEFSLFSLESKDPEQCMLRIIDQLSSSQPDPQDIALLISKKQFYQKHWVKNIRKAEAMRKLRATMGRPLPEGVPEGSSEGGESDALGGNSPVGGLWDFPKG